jgi:transcription elongation factor Elf1
MQQEIGSIHEEIPEFHDYQFIGPHCGKGTTVISATEHSVVRLVTCNLCEKQFIIHDNQPERLAS